MYTVDSYNKLTQLASVRFIYFLSLYLNMGFQGEKEEKHICLLNVRAWAKIVAWMQIIWYALVFVAAQQQWPRDILMCFYGSETYQFLTTKRQDRNEELLLKVLVNLAEAAIMITSLIEILMGTILLLGITNRSKGCMLWWMVYAGGSIISPLLTDTIPNREDIIHVIPLLLLKTVFYGTGIYIVRTQYLEIFKRPDDKMHEKKACITVTV